MATILGGLWRSQKYMDLLSYLDLPEPHSEDERFVKELEYLRTVSLEKDNRVSAKKRLEADKLFQKRRFNEALCKYTASMRYAETIDDIGLLFYKRADVFFHMKEYRKALEDIKNAEDYDMQNLPELIKLKQLIPSQSSPQSEQSEDNGIIGFAEDVVVQIGDKSLRNVVAKNYIASERRVLVEQAFIVSHRHGADVCCTCYATYKNFVVCKKCAFAVFCDLECAYANKTHKFYCDSLYGVFRERMSRKNVNNEDWKIQLAIEAVFYGLHAFSDLLTWRLFVELTLDERPNIIPVSHYNDMSVYHFFFKLKRLRWQRNVVASRHAFMLAMEIPKIAKFFDNNEKRLFLMQLLTEHIAICEANAFRCELGVMIGNYQSLFNHSCAPNAKTTLDDNEMVVQTTRPVEKGEQIFISYLPEEDEKKSKKERRELLLQGWEFICECSRCLSEV